MWLSCKAFKCRCAINFELSQKGPDRIHLQRREETPEKVFGNLVPDLVRRQLFQSCLQHNEYAAVMAKAHKGPELDPVVCLHQLTCSDKKPTSNTWWKKKRGKEAKMDLVYVNKLIVKKTNLEGLVKPKSRCFFSEQLSDLGPFFPIHSSKGIAKCCQLHSEPHCSLHVPPAPEPSRSAGR